MTQRSYRSITSQPADPIFKVVIARSFGIKTAAEDT